MVNCPSPQPDIAIAIQQQPVNNARPANPNLPSEEYLALKRKSIFSKPYEESVQEIADNFVAPVYEKSQS